MACILLWSSFTSIQEDGCDKGSHHLYLGTERNTSVISHWFQSCQCCCCSASRQSLHSLRHGDQCREDQAHDKQTSGINTEIKVNGQKLETVTSFKYLGSVITDGVSKPEILSRIAQATAALTMRNQVGLRRVFLSAPRYDWCAPLSHSSSCMLVNHGSSQQSSKEEYKPWKVLPQETPHLIQRPCYQRGSPCQDPAGNWTTWRSPDDRKETQTAVVWSCFLFIRSGQHHLARHSERGKKTRQTKEEVGRQHLGMDRPGVQQFQEGNGEQGKMEKTGCKIICGAPMTLVIKELMMVMMMGQ